MIHTRISNGLALVATLFALAGAVVFEYPQFSQRPKRSGWKWSGPKWSGHNVSGAPGPIAGAGLPVLAVGYGVYWLIKRRRRKAE